MNFSFYIAAILIICCIALVSLLTSKEEWDKNISNEDLVTAAEIPSTEDEIVEAEKEIQEMFKSFNQTNPHRDSWCPKAVCNNSPLCQPCNKRFLFIVATGRSGSTTLLRMLNYLPNVRLSGENSNELFIASKLQTNLQKGGKKKIFANDERYNGTPWMHNAIPSQALACPMQQIMSTINPPPHEILMELNQPGNPSYADYEASLIIGAKMIRIQDGNWNAKTAVAYFQENFPCSRFLVNYRSDTDGQVESELNLGWQNITKDDLKRSDQFLRKFAKLMSPDIAQLLDMNEWTKDVSILNNVVKWLGYKGCSFKALLHENHDGYGRDNTDSDLGPQCRYPYD